MSKVDGNRKKTGGRKKGTPNKTTALLKDAILQAATAAGDGDLAKYLQARAIDSPNAFLALLGKVLPLQVTGADGNAIQHKHDVRFIIVPGQPRS